MVSSIVQWLLEAVFTILEFVLAFLPSIDWPSASEIVAEYGLSDYLGYLNWFVPVEAIYQATVIWAMGVALYQIWSYWYHYVRNKADKTSG